RVDECGRSGPDHALAVGRQFDRRAVFAARQHAVLLTRDVDQLVQEEIAKHERDRERREEYRQRGIGDRPRTFAAGGLRWPAYWCRMAAFIFHRHCPWRSAATDAW